MNLEQLRFPIGDFQNPKIITPENIDLWISEIKTIPTQIADAINPLTEQQLDTPYRPDG